MEHLTYPVCFERLTQLGGQPNRAFYYDSIQVESEKAYHYPKLINFRMTKIAGIKTTEVFKSHICKAKLNIVSYVHQYIIIKISHQMPKTGSN